MFPHVSTLVIKKIIYSFFIKTVETCGNMWKLVLMPNGMGGNMYRNMHGNMCGNLHKTKVHVKVLWKHAFS